MAGASGALAAEAVNTVALLGRLDASPVLSAALAACLDAAERQQKSKGGKERRKKEERGAQAVRIGEGMLQQEECEAAVTRTDSGPFEVIQNVCREKLVLHGHFERRVSTVVLYQQGAQEARKAAVHGAHQRQSHIAVSRGAIITTDDVV